MGVCNCLPEPGPLGFILPEQEIVIYRHELAHPMAHLKIEDLLAAFIPNPLDKIPVQDFFRNCIGLEVSPSEFTTRTSPYCLYLYKLRANSDTIELETLLVSLTLLCNSPWETKLYALLCTFNNDFSSVSYQELRKIIETVVFVATEVHPAMALISVSSDFLGVYTEKIQKFSDYLFNRVLRHWPGGLPIDIEEFFKAFQEHDELQMLLWSSGVRMMLVEEDIKNVGRPVPTPTTTFKRTYISSICLEEDSTAFSNHCKIHV